MYVSVVPYQPSWPLAYEQEAACLKEVLSGLLVSIHHIGSTSVPGLAAKPIIDILPVVTEITAVDALADALYSSAMSIWGHSGFLDGAICAKAAHIGRIRSIYSEQKVDMRLNATWLYATIFGHILKRQLPMRR